MNVLIILQIVLSTILIFFIILQTRGTGFGRVWGSSHSSFTRRGLEKMVFKATFVVAALFVVVSILQFVV